MAKYIKTEQGYIDASIFAPAQFKPEGKSYLTFSSPKNFTLKVNNATKNWDGILEYFASDKTWTVWDGTTILSAYNNDGEYVLYLRGTGNTKITGPTANGSSDTYRWVLTGSDIACVGNIENLLDYATVESGQHPTMAEACYVYMFYGCTSLTQAPTLTATTLADYCYCGMFVRCTSLTQAPVLPAITLSKGCYQDMFFNCTSLTQAPTLTATTLADYCYADMFYGCTSLTQAPALSATTLSSHCYHQMFSGCTSLTQAPALPSTTLSEGCYYYMFHGCTSLIHAPALPATTLAPSCYRGMFSGCTSLTQVPALPATTLVNSCYQSMFSGCTSLKLSSTKTGEYTVAYRIPTTGAGSAAGNDVKNMFTSTGGTFTAAPEINTTYYLSTDNMIVRNTEVATLNGYVGSMIDVASVQPDWNQNDDTKPDYVKNRTHYEEVLDEYVIFEGTLPKWETTEDLPLQYAIPSDTRVTAYHNGSIVATVVGSDGGTNKVVYMFTPDLTLTVDNIAMKASVYNGFGDGVLKFVVENFTTVHTLDEKYLPNNVRGMINSKMDANNPVGTGSFSMGRKPDSVIGGSSHAEGSNTTASGDNSHAEGISTIAGSSYQHVQGRNNIEDSSDKYAHIVGNGTGKYNRSNAHTLDWNGIPWFQGRPQFGGTAQDQGSQPVMANGDKEIILASSTANSTKKFKITVDDSGTLTATKITQ